MIKNKKIILFVVAGLLVLIIVTVSIFLLLNKKEIEPYQIRECTINSSKDEFDAQINVTIASTEDNYLLWYQRTITRKYKDKELYNNTKSYKNVDYKLKSNDDDYELTFTFKKEVVIKDDITFDNYLKELEDGGYTCTLLDK